MITTHPRSTRRMRTGFLLSIGLAFASALSAFCETSPYTDLQGRQIKALSSEQIASYLAGHGMGRALAAELNGYPGPKHVLELAGEISLSALQHQEITAIFDAMQSAAAALGERIVAAESALDKAFSDLSISDSKLRESTALIGQLEGQLRAVHLAAHLETKVLLTPEQIHRYEISRGYQEMDHSQMGHGQHH